jgi:hypothetical protein
MIGAFTLCAICAIRLPRKDHLRPSHKLHSNPQTSSLILAVVEFKIGACSQLCMKFNVDTYMRFGNRTALGASRRIDN